MHSSLDNLAQSLQKPAVVAVLQYLPVVPKQLQAASLVVVEGPAAAQPEQTPKSLLSGPGPEPQVPSQVRGKQQPGLVLSSLFKFLSQQHSHCRASFTHFPESHLKPSPHTF